MKKINLVFIIAFIVTSCTSTTTRNPSVAYAKDENLEYQNTVCTLIGDADNFDKEYYTFAYSGNYERASIEEVRKNIYGKKIMAKYPFNYSTLDFLNGLFKLEKSCDNDNIFIVIDDVELRHHFIHMGKMGSMIVEYYLVINSNITGENEKTYTALTKTPKYNAFTSSKKVKLYNLEAKKAAFKNIFKQIDDDLKQLK